MTTAYGFYASLPDTLTDEQFVRLVKWGKESCQKSDVFMKDGTMHIIAIRKEAKTARSFQSLLRTLMTNWGVELPQKMVGWLELITPDQFETRKRAPYQKPPEIDIENTYRLRLPENLLRVPMIIRGA